MSTCLHKNIHLINPYELIRKYKCQACGEIMMCECDRDIGIRFLSHQINKAIELNSQNEIDVSIGFVENICDECRGLKPKPYPVAEIYGRSSKIHRYYWREISFETMRRFALFFGCDDSDVVTEMALNQKISDKIEKEVVNDIKELHNTAPKYIYTQESAADILKKYKVPTIDLKANYVKSSNRKVKIEKNGVYYSAESFAEDYLINNDFNILHSESIPFHVIFGSFMWLLIQDNFDEKCRMVGFGDRFAFEDDAVGQQIWTILPEDFGTAAYYFRRKKEIKEHFKSFPNDKEELIWLFDLWLDPSANLRQYLWAHREEDIEQARKILQILPVKTTIHILEYLIKDYWGHYLGWPDILAYKNNNIEFFEVKSSKDKLREYQKTWIKGNYHYLKFQFSIIKIHKNTV